MSTLLSGARVPTGLPQSILRSLSFVDHFPSFLIRAFGPIADNDRSGLHSIAHLSALFLRECAFGEAVEGPCAGALSANRLTFVNKESVKCTKGANKRSNRYYAKAAGNYLLFIQCA